MERIHFVSSDCGDSSSVFWNKFSIHNSSIEESNFEIDKKNLEKYNPQNLIEMIRLIRNWPTPNHRVRFSLNLVFSLESLENANRETKERRHTQYDCFSLFSDWKFCRWKTFVSFPPPLPPPRLGFAIWLSTGLGALVTLLLFSKQFISERRLVVFLFFREWQHFQGLVLESQIATD